MSGDAGGREHWGRWLVAQPIARGLDDTVLGQWAAAVVLRELTPAEPLRADGGGPLGLVLVVSGSLRLTHPSRATPLPTRLGPGSVFADDGLPVYVPAALVAAEATTIAVLPPHALRPLLASQPELRDRVVAESLAYLRRLQLASTPLFHALGATALDALADHVAFVKVARGEVVMREGEAPDCLYLVVTGSLEVFRAGPPSGVALDVLDEGAVAGEMGVLTQEPRSLSVRARRDSTLLRVPGPVFDRLLDEHAGVSRQLARTLSDRLKRTTVTAAAAPRRVSTIAVLRACDQAMFAACHGELLEACARAGRPVRSLAGPPAGAALESDRLAAMVAAAEHARELVVFDCDGHHAGYTEWGVLQADLVLVVAASGSAPDPALAAASLPRARAHGARVELVLVRAPGAAPRGTAAWLDAWACDAHHHVTAASAADHDRLVRRLTGTAWGLVLGGGGARGFAHIGVIRALHEAGVPIDMIGGTSMGAILAAQYAMGADPRQMLELTRRAYVDGRGSRDLTLPLVALRTGRATLRTLRAMLGEHAIEDLPTPYFAVSCNLTRARVEVHDRGPAWFWARVSCSVPGLLPPVPCGGDVLIDGGLLDNLPVAEMRRRLGGRVAASNASVDVDLEVDAALTPDAPWSGGTQMRRMLSGEARLPTIVDVLMRTAEIGSVRDSHAAGSPADLYLDLPVDGIGMSEFSAIDRLVTLGYDYTARRIEHYRAHSGRDAF
jgi:NTE family protein